jgi:hypothetical protein
VADSAVITWRDVDRQYSAPGVRVRIQTSARRSADSGAGADSLVVRLPGLTTIAKSAATRLRLEIVRASAPPASLRDEHLAIPFRSYHDEATEWVEPVMGWLLGLSVLTAAILLFLPGIRRRALRSRADTEERLRLVPRRRHSS